MLNTFIYFYSFLFLISIFIFCFFFSFIFSLMTVKEYRNWLLIYCTNKDGLWKDSEFITRQLKNQNTEIMKI